MSARKQKVRVDALRIAWRDDPIMDSAEYVQAIADCSYPIGTDGTRRLVTFRSAGLFGITFSDGHTQNERDGDTAYAREVEEEQIDELRSHLTVFGIIVSPADWRKLREQMGGRK